MLSVTQKLLVAAIELGIDDSGYAFSFSHEYNKDPTKVNIRLYNAGEFLSSVKQPTCVLCDQAMKFRGFGYEAEEKFSDLSDNMKQKEWYFFPKLVMSLLEQQFSQVNMECQLKDNHGKKMPAIKVFSMAIRYLKNELLHAIDSCYGRDVSSANDIHWVLAVSAIWTASAKDFLREAAIEAGIDGSKLTIVLATDAAAVYCQFLLPSDRLSCGGRFDDDKYMVIDIGGTELVFSVHEKQPDGTIKEVYKDMRGYCGSDNVGREFIQMIIKIVGSSTFKQFCDYNPDYRLDLLRHLEVKLRDITPDRDKVSIRVPFALETAYTENTGKRVQDAVEQTCYKGKIQWSSSKMRLNAELFRSFFNNYIIIIKDGIENLCQMPGVKGTSTFIMIGKFSGYPLVQDALIKAFPKAMIVIPKEPDLAVLKGAVALGHKLGLTCDYNFQWQQPTNKDHSALTTTFAKRDEDVSSDNYADGATCSSSSEQGIRKGQIRNMKNQKQKDKKSFRDDGEDALSSDFLKMSIQTQDKSTQGLKTQLKNQTTLKADNTRAPSDDELFALSRQLNKLDKEWWLLAKLLGLSDEQINDIELTKGDTLIVRQYYKMLTAWKRHNAGQEKGSVRYLLRKCNEAGIDRKVTNNVFGN